jgi:hypothetical protein
MSDNTDTSDIVDIPCELYPIFKRNNYFYGKLLTVNDFRNEQQYFVNKQRLSNRLIHGTGVVCGLQAVQKNATQITISPGVALDLCGREIVVSLPYDFDVQQNLPSGAAGTVNVYLKFDFCGIDSVTKVLKSSNCKDDCCYGTIKEGFKVEAQLPKAAAAVAENICVEWADYLKDPTNDKFCIEACPDISQDGVLLAEVTYTKTDAGAVTIQKVVNNRPIVFGNNTLFRLLECLKDEARTDLPKIEKIDWKHNETFIDLEAWLARLFTSRGFNITFDRLMDTSTINDSTVCLSLECYKKDVHIPIFEKIEIAIKPFCTTLNTKKTNLQIVLSRVNFMERAYNYFSANGINENYSKVRLRFQIKGDFVCDAKGKCLDANFLRGKLPTGDGKEGGLFESWITLKFPFETAINLQAEPATAALGQQITLTSSITPAPPTDKDVFHAVNLSYTDPAGNTVQVGKYNSDETGKITIPPLKLPVIGAYTFLLSYPGETFSSTGEAYKSSTTQQTVTVNPRYVKKENEVLTMADNKVVEKAVVNEAAFVEKAPDKVNG